MYLFKKETFRSKVSSQDISNMKNMKNTKAIKIGRIPLKLNFQKKKICIGISKTMLFENQLINVHCSPQLKQLPLLCNFIQRFILLNKMAIRV